MPLWLLLRGGGTSAPTKDSAPPHLTGPAVGALGWRRVPVWAAVTGGGIGLLVLIGWLVDVRVLRSVSPDYTSMKPNTAIACLCLAVAVIALNRTMLLALALALPVAIGLATIVEYAAGINVGFDELLFKDGDHVPGAVAGRLAPNAAIAILLLAAALVTLRRDGSVAASRGQAFALGASSIGLLGVVGYLGGIERLYGFGGFAPMALPTAVALIVLGAGVLWLRPSEGLMRLVTKRSLGGVFARRVVPFALVAPPLVFGARHLAVDAGVGSAVADWFAVTVEVAVLAGGALFAVALVDRLEERARAAEKHREQAEAVFHRFVDSIRDHTIGLTDLSGQLLTVVGAESTMLDHTADELTNEAARSSRGSERHLTSVSRSATLRVRKDGSPRWVNVIVTPFFDDAGDHVGYVEVGRDVTAARLAREMLAERTDELERSNMELGREAERYSQLFGSATDVIFSLDLFGSITSTNPSATRVSGFERAELLGMNVFDLIAPEDREKALDAFVRRLGGGEDAVQEFQNDAQGRAASRCSRCPDHRSRTMERPLGSSRSDGT